MNSESASHSFAALSHPGRLDVFRLLVRHAPAGLRPHEMAAALSLRPNTLSNYLSALEEAGLVRHSREGRAVHYHARTDHAGALIDYLAQDCCRGRAPVCPPPETRATTAPRHVLFVCSGNSARSLLAEALLRDLGGGRLIAHSAGTTPRGAAHPLTLDLLARHGHDTTGLAPRGLSPWRDPGAPRMDLVLTVCDDAASCDTAPLPGQPVQAHWGLPDPVAVTDAAARGAAFARTYTTLRRRIAALAALPFERLDRAGLQRRLDEIALSQTEDLT